MLRVILSVSLVLATVTIAVLIPGLRSALREMSDGE